MVLRAGVNIEKRNILSPLPGIKARPTSQYPAAIPTAILAHVTKRKSLDKQVTVRLNPRNRLCLAWRLKKLEPYRTQMFVIVITKAYDLNISLKNRSNGLIENRTRGLSS
jgi:hypothetical protein